MTKENGIDENSRVVILSKTDFDYGLDGNVEKRRLPSESRNRDV